jgi:peptide/nickel transport system substrate-binding protein
MRRVGFSWVLVLFGWVLAKTSVVVGLDADPPNLDPVFSSALVDRQVLNQVYDKLVDLDENLKIVPMLATSWVVGDNGLTYTFRLRQGVKFHDGTEFDAAAVKFNLDRALTVEGSRRKGELALVKEVQVVDKYTVKVVLRDTFAPFLYVLTDRAGMMVSPVAVQRYGQDFANNPVGTGPFRFVERRRQDRIVLARNGQYWRKGFPKIDELVYRPYPDDDVRLANLVSGAATVITPLAPKDLDRVRSSPELALYAFPSLGFQGIWLNVTRPPFNNKALRQALAATIDRETIDRVVFLGTATPANGPFPPGSPGYDPKIPVPKRDIGLARKKLQEAGFPNGFSFTLLTAPGPVLTQLAQVYQAMAAEAGIRIQIQQVEFGTLLDRTDRKDYEAALLGWSGRPDPDGNIYDFMRCGGPLNNAGYCNPKVDALLNRARATRVLEVRRSLYSEALKIILEDVPYIYVYHPQVLIGTSKRLANLPLIPDGILRFAGVDLK